MTLAWYAVSVSTRSESSASRELLPRVTEVFVPVRNERRAWSDRVVNTEVPLFPGYVFVRTEMSPARRIQLLKVRSVNDLVGRFVGGQASDARVARAIPDAQLEALRIVVNAARSIDPVETFVAGRLVLVATGPLRGAHGIVEHGADGRRRLVVQLHLLGRGVRTVLSADDVVEMPVADNVDLGTVR